MRLARSASGTGPPMLLLHGGGSGRGTWDAFTRSVEGYHVVAPDLRGHGNSPRSAGYPLRGYAEDVVELMDELSLGPAVLIGHSLGGHTASLIAQHHPSRVSRLVLEDPPAPPRGGAPGGFSRLRLAVSGLVGGLSPRRRFDRHALMSAITQLREPDPAWWADLQKIEARTLVLSGGPTSHIAPSRLSAMAAEIPAAQLLTIPAGHRIHSTALPAFTAAVLDFLAS